MSRDLVLLVTYNADEQILYRDALHGAGFDVRVLADGDTALRDGVALRPAAVVARLPRSRYVITGAELIEYIRRDEHSRDIAIVMLTSIDAISHLQTVTDLDCDECLLMPAFPEEVVSAVTRAVARRGPVQRPVQTLL